MAKKKSIETKEAPKDAPKTDDTKKGKAVVKKAAEAKKTEAKQAEKKTEAKKPVGKKVNRKPAGKAKDKSHKLTLIVYPAITSDIIDSTEVFQRLGTTLNQVNSSVVTNYDEASDLAAKLYGEQGLISVYMGYANFIKDERQLETYNSSLKQIISASYEKLKKFSNGEPKSAKAEEKKEETKPEQESEIEESVFVLPSPCKVNNVDAKTALLLMGYSRDAIDNSFINKEEDKDLFLKEVAGEGGMIAQALAYKEFITSAELPHYQDLLKQIIEKTQVKLQNWIKFPTSTVAAPAQIIAPPAPVNPTTPPPAPVAPKTLEETLDAKLKDVVALIENHKKTYNLHLGHLTDFLSKNSTNGYVLQYNAETKLISCSFGHLKAEQPFEI